MINFLCWNNSQGVRGDLFARFTGANLHNNTDDVLPPYCHIFHFRLIFHRRDDELKKFPRSPYLWPSLRIVIKLNRTIRQKNSKRFIKFIVNLAPFLFLLLNIVCTSDGIIFLCELNRAFHNKRKIILKDVGNSGLQN